MHTDKNHFTRKAFIVKLTRSGSSIALFVLNFLMDTHFTHCVYISARYLYSVTNQIELDGVVGVDMSVRLKNFRGIRENLSGFSSDGKEQLGCLHRNFSGYLTVVCLLMLP